MPHYWSKKYEHAAYRTAMRSVHRPNTLHLVEWQTTRKADKRVGLKTVRLTEEAKESERISSAESGNSYPNKRTYCYIAAIISFF